MKKYILYPCDNNFKEIKVFSSIDNYQKFSVISNLDKSKFKPEDSLFFLLPSSLINSYEYKYDSDLDHKTNLANFIASIDSYVVDDISGNKFFLHNDVGYAIKNDILDELNESLSDLLCKIFIVPEHAILFNKENDTILEFDKKIIFSNKNGTGFSCNKDFANQYMEILKSNLPDYQPLVCVEDKSVLSLLDNPISDFKFKISSFIESIEIWPNLYEYKFSFKSFFSKFEFSKYEYFFIATLLVMIFTMPIVLTEIYLNKADVYEKNTYSIFKMIDSNTNRVVSPKNQIDQLLNQIPLDTVDQKVKSLKLENFDYFISLSEKYIKNIEINNDSNQAKIEFIGMPQIQFNLITNFSAGYINSIDDTDIKINGEEVSGTILVLFK